MHYVYIRNADQNSHRSGSNQICCSGLQHTCNALHTDLSHLLAKWCTVCRVHATTTTIFDSTCSYTTCELLVEAVQLTVITPRTSNQLAANACSYCTERLLYLMPDSLSQVSRRLHHGSEAVFQSLPSLLCHTLCFNHCLLYLLVCITETLSA